MDWPESNTSAVARLPDDPLVEILSRLPVKSLCRSKCVSRAWRDLIAEPLHRKKLPQTLEGFFYKDNDGSDGEISGSDTDGGGGGGYEDTTMPYHGRRHFIDPLGRSARLVDPSFPFLTKLPAVVNLRLLHSCNGLLLFGHGPKRYDAQGYIVCNPATEQWAEIPSSGWAASPPEAAEDEGGDDDDDDDDGDSNNDYDEHTYLIFDPVVSSHFQLVQFVLKASIERETRVLTYSPETGVWIDRASEQEQPEEGDHRQQLGSFGGIAVRLGCAFVNGMLHLIAYHIQKQRELIVAVDRTGKTRKVMCWPEMRGCGWCESVFLGLSEGRLHCMTQNQQGTSVFIWVLEDYDKEEWVLKHRVTSLQLFGKSNCNYHAGYNVVAIHPDCSFVFIVQRWDRKLISYEMNRMKVHALRTLGHSYEVYESITPYVPYFLELSVLSNRP
ncbi:hypothetical protein ACP70R_021172 [Stipagrostis hirtigluma subsp. patula]